MTSRPKKKCVFLNFPFIYVSFQILFNIPVTDGNGSVFFRDFVPSVMERHIKSARHLPLCILFRKSATDGSKLEKHVYTLWKNESNNYKDWQFGSYSFDKSEMVRERKPQQMPALKCYLGQSSSYMYEGKTKKSLIHQWLNRLVDQHAEQLQDASPELVRVAMETHNVTILAFPDHYNHHHVEEKVFELSEKTLSCKAFVIHPYSIHASELREIYEVPDIPAILVLTKDSRKRNKFVPRLFSRQHIQTSMLDIHLQALQIRSVHRYTEEEFGKNVMTLRGTLYIPKVMVFYAYWGVKVQAYLSAFRRSVEEFKDLGVLVEYGMVDLAQEAGKKLVSKWVRSEVSRNVPFTILFHTDVRNDFLIQHGLKEDRPTPSVLYQLFQSATINITYWDGRLFDDYLPYGQTDSSQYSLLDEGPRGQLCHPWSHNRTDSDPPLPVVKQRKRKAPPTKTRTTERGWHERHGSEKVDKRLKKFHGIPLLTHDMWSEVIEKSHAPSHPLLGGHQWAGEVTKVALVVFVKTDCRSCANSLETLLKVQKALRFLDGGSLYLVNCTTERELCGVHNIRGYPYITAFRGQGWLGYSHCVSPGNQHLPYTRMDFHGVIQEKNIMEWFANVAGTSIVNLMFEKPDEEMKEDVRLVGTLIPRYSRFLPRPPHSKNPEYYFPYQCFRLVCERLFGKAVCYSAYSVDIPAREYEDQHLELVVTKVMMHRRDGAEAVITQLGKSIVSILEEQEGTAIHRFHRKHSYTFGPTLKCEEDHGVCTDFITSFTLDHARLPVTHITSDAFHTQIRSEDEDHPVLIALVHQDNVTQDSPFLQTLHAVASELYDRLVVTTLDVNQYPAWAGQFVPADYKTILIREDRDIEGMYSYPRMCIVSRNDHRKAAFYPPLGRNKNSSKWFQRDIIKKFVEKVLTNPGKHMVQTEHF
ncbi:uncharacterized protein LOC125669548 [Ostrea edulis]|uniref:uncharacterized protein LOC125669548 n=1 Tax=Ostrea edulis TaxID=37623 RepID=UPI0024AF8149|nr:uncharacterized protein LOC125669548 [Ostrea edulis]